jgi:hypothetical protein
MISFFTSPRAVMHASRGIALLALAMFAFAVHAQSTETKCPAPPARPGEAEMRELAANAQDRGFMWRIEKNGRVSHLFGTIHINKVDWSLPGKMTLEAVRASDVIALEMDILDPAVQQAMGDPAKAGIKPLDLPVGMKQRMAAAASSVCLPITAISTLHPMFQMVTLTLVDARFDNFDTQFGTDAFFASFARGAKKPVAGLETPEVQMRALLAGDEKDLLARIDSGLGQFEAKANRKIMQRMIASWANSDLADLENYAEWCDCSNTVAERAFYRRINDDRNPALAAGIDKLHRSGKSVFAAVGTLHMTGPKGLPKLLKQMGYKVERVAFAR